MTGDGPDDRGGRATGQGILLRPSQGLDHLARVAGGYGRVERIAPPRNNHIWGGAPARFGDEFSGLGEGAFDRAERVGSTETALLVQESALRRVNDLPGVRGAPHRQEGAAAWTCPRRSHPPLRRTGLRRRSTTPRRAHGGPRRASREHERSQQQKTSSITDRDREEWCPPGMHQREHTNARGASDAGRTRCQFFMRGPRRPGRVVAQPNHRSARAAFGCVVSRLKPGRPGPGATTGIRFPRSRSAPAA